MEKISKKCLKDLTDEGLNPSQIAKACNMSRQAIHQRLNYKSRSTEKEKLARKLISKGATVKQIQKKLGHTKVGTTYTYLKRIGVNPSKEKRNREKAMIRILLSKGYNLEDISKELNISKSKVWYRKRSKKDDEKN